MNELVIDTLIWAVLAACGIGAVSALFIWRPWARRGRPPHHHHAE